MGPRYHVRPNLRPHRRRGASISPRRLREAMNAIRYRNWSDHDILQMARSGDDEAFDAFAQRHRRGIYAMGLASLGSVEQATAVLCDAFVSAHRDLGSAAAEIRPVGWLYMHGVRAVLTRLGSGPAGYSIERRPGPPR